MSAKARLLACALDELEKNGVEAFSLRAVGAAAGLSPMAVYRHFKNREDLLLAAGEEAFDAWRTRVEAISAAQPLDWMREAARAYIEFALDQPARFDACFVLRTRVERLYPDDFRAGKSPAVAIVVARIKEAQRQGLFGASDDPLEIGMTFWAEVHGLAMLWRCGRFVMEREAFLDFCVRCTERVMVGFAAGARS